MVFTKFCKNSYCSLQVRNNLFFTYLEINHKPPAVAGGRKALCATSLTGIHFLTCWPSFRPLRQPKQCAINRCSDLQSKIGKPAIKGIFQTTLSVADCNRKPSGLQSARIQDRIICNYRYRRDHIISYCKFSSDRDKLIHYFV